jgi:hypothetical protein
MTLEKLKANYADDRVDRLDGIGEKPQGVESDFNGSAAWLLPTMAICMMLITFWIMIFG